MPGRRGARAGRGWDAIPPRQDQDDPPGGEPRRGGRERGNASARWRRGSLGEPATGDEGTAPAHPDEPDDIGGGREGTGRDRAGFGGDGLGGDGFGGAGRGRSGFGGAGRGRSGFGAAGRGRVGPDGTGRGRAGLDGTGRGGAGRDKAGRDGVDGEKAGRAQPELSEPERAREICLRQLAVRPRTRSELAKVLARREISEEVIAEVLDRYDEVGIIDDAAFARAWVSTRHQGRGLARRALANELRQRGVDSEVANEALESVDPESEAATARALVDRKLRTARGAPDAVFRRLVAMLARKGYPAGVAVGAVKEALAARDAEAAEFAEQIDADAADEEFTT